MTSERSPIAWSRADAMGMRPSEAMYSGMSASTGSCFNVGGSALAQPSSICWIWGRSLSDPEILIGFTACSSAIVWPMAVRAVATVAALTICLCP